MHMRNQAATTQSPAHLDNIEVGCQIDGSHMHPDDFNAQVIQYAEQFGYQPDDAPDVRWMVYTRMCDLDRHLTDEGRAYVSEGLTEEADRAEAWLNEHVADDAHAFHVDESSLFLSPAADLEADSTDDGPWVYHRSGDL